MSQVKLTGTSQRLKQCVQKSAIGVNVLAKASDLSTPWIYDLMRSDDEIYYNLSLNALKKLCDSLNIEPVFLLTGDSVEIGRLTEDDLKIAIRDYLQSGTVSQSQLEEHINYALEDETGKWYPLNDWNLEKLVALAENLKLDWRRFL